MRPRMTAPASLCLSLLLLAAIGCQQENPVERAGKDVTEYTRGAIDKAKGVGGTLEGAAARTAEQVREASEVK